MAVVVAFAAFIEADDDVILIVSFGVAPFAANVVDGPSPVRERRHVAPGRRRPRPSREAPSDLVVFIHATPANDEFEGCRRCTFTPLVEQPLVTQQ